MEKKIEEFVEYIREHSKKNNTHFTLTVSPFGFNTNMLGYHHHSEPEAYGQANLKGEIIT